MNDKILIKGGSGDVPALTEKELAYRKDKMELYIGTNDGNVRLCGAGDKTELENQIKTLKTALDAVSERITALEKSDETGGDISGQNN